MVVGIVCTVVGKEGDGAGELVQERSFRKRGNVSSLAGLDGLDDICFCSILFYPHNHAIVTNSTYL